MKKPEPLDITTIQCVCSKCFDEGGYQNFNGMVPGAQCIVCHRVCLGYAISDFPARAKA